MIFFISGGARGLGAAMVEMLVKNRHQVAFTYHHSKKNAQILASRLNGDQPSCLALPMDVRDANQVDRTIKTVIQHFNGLDVVINNAAIHQAQLAIHLSDTDWQNMLTTNLSGAFYLSRAALTEFMGQSYGRLIHISSIAAGGAKGSTAYSASKAGLEGLSAALAKEYGRYGITSNIIRLGLAKTESAQKGAHQDIHTFWNQFCPVGRLATDQDLFQMIQFLASKEATFINGAVLLLSGGLDWIP
ncbi:SDR family NAD(P)-dependent oxidoreductase [Magnetococcales bacterium HHB-1]